MEYGGIDLGKLTYDRENYTSSNLFFTKFFYISDSGIRINKEMRLPRYVKIERRIYVYKLFFFKNTHCAYSYRREILFL